MARSKAPTLMKLSVLFLFFDYTNEGQRNDEDTELAIPLPVTTPHPPDQVNWEAGDFIHGLWDRRNGTGNRTIAEPFVETRSVAAIVVQSVSMVIIITGSILGNVLLLITLSKRRQLQNKTSVLVANMAISDLLNALLSMPFILVSSIVGFWTFNDALCSLSGAMAILMCSTSINTLAVIAYERYSAIVYPLVYHMRITHSRIAGLISWTWIQGLFFCLCPLLGWSSYIYIDNEYICMVDWSQDVAYTYTIIVFNFFVPFFVMIYCYGHIFRVARKHSRSVANFSVCSPRSNTCDPGPRIGPDRWADAITKTSAKIAANTLKYKKEAKAATILLVVMGTFLACWIPHGCTMFCLALGEFCSLDIPDVMYTTTTWLAMCASLCNPVVYGVMNRQYREAFHSIFCSVCPFPQPCKPNRKRSASQSDDDPTTGAETNSSGATTRPNLDLVDLENPTHECRVFVIVKSEHL